MPLKRMELSGTGGNYLALGQGAATVNLSSPTQLGALTTWVAVPLGNLSNNSVSLKTP